VCLEREPGLNHGAVAVPSELDPAGLPLTGLLLAFSSISARPDHRVYSDVLGLQSGRVLGRITTERVPAARSISWNCPARPRIVAATPKLLAV
jgi:hypothetical protein